MSIEITSEAAKQSLEILKDLGDSGDLYLGLRFGIKGGGCSGFQYVIAPAQDTDEFDTIFEKDGLKVYVDSMSLQYLDGATIDYEKTITGASLIIKNPNSHTSCGCGQSFN